MVSKQAGTEGRLKIDVQSWFVNNLSKGVPNQ